MPSTLEKTCTPRAPSSFTLRWISSMHESGLFSASEAMKVGKRFGCCAQSSAMPSLQMRASSGLSFGPASASMGGMPAESTW